MRDTHEPALALHFSVSIGGLKIERFMACDGLTAEYEIEEYREGGTFGYVHRLPVRLKYTNVKLTRAVDADSGRLAGWFTSIQTRPLRQPATVIAYDGNAKEVARWELAGAWPVRYTGPQLNAAGTTAATETLELAHDGFVVVAA
jgi:phage tail-like protein